jgi:hypothetical protein
VQIRGRQLKSGGKKKKIKVVYNIKPRRKFEGFFIFVKLLNYKIKILNLDIKKKGKNK